MAVKSYRELIAWQKAMDLAQVVYTATRTLPKEELYGLTLQMRRASVSVPSNVAEGQGRKSTKEFLHHLSIAVGSLCELETLVLLSSRLEYLKPEAEVELLELAAEVGRVINGLMKSLAMDR